MTEAAEHLRVLARRLRVPTARMRIAPADLAEWIERLVEADPRSAAEELERLVAETRALVPAELPELELSLRHEPGAREQPSARP